MKPITLLLTSSIVLFISMAAAAQDIKIPTDSTQLVSIETNDGNEFFGHILSIESDHITMRVNNLGTINVRKQDIKRLRTIDPKRMVQGDFWYESPNTTRYFFGPNGYGLHKGEGYYQNTWVLFNQVSYGVTDNFTIGAGIVPLFVFDGTPSPVWITPKVSIPIKKDKINVGVGGLFAFILGEDAESFGIAYGQLSLGSRDRNVNLGLGYGYAGGSWASTPTVSISGMYRTGKHFALMTENYFFDAGDSNYLLLSGGGRFILRRIAIDAGFVVPTQTEDTFIALPWLGISVPFGRASGS